MKVVLLAALLALSLLVPTSDLRAAVGHERVILKIGMLGVQGSCNLGIRCMYIFFLGSSAKRQLTRGCQNRGGPNFAGGYTAVGLL